MRNIILLLSLTISFSALSNELIFDSKSIEGIAFNNDTYLYSDDLTKTKSDEIYLDSGKIVIKEIVISKIQFLQLSNGMRSSTMAIKKGGDMGGGGL